MGFEKWLHEKVAEYEMKAEVLLSNGNKEGARRFIIRAIELKATLETYTLFKSN